MSGSSSTYILPGRHQPPHFDHLRLIRLALEVVPAEFYLGLVTSVLPRGEPDTDFERSAREHHLPERAPFSFDQRRRMLDAALSEALPASERRRVHLIPLPRPENDFEVIKSIFPGPRVWIIPDVGEDFDELKARFFRREGDTVLRIHAPNRVSGRVVRALIAAEAWTQLETYTPKSVIHIIRKARMGKQAT